MRDKKKPAAFSVIFYREGEEENKKEMEGIKK
jgi:hypothetical protein